LVSVFSCPVHRSSKRILFVLAEAHQSPRHQLSHKECPPLFFTAFFFAGPFSFSTELASLDLQIIRHSDAPVNHSENFHFAAFLIFGPWFPSFWVVYFYTHGSRF